MDQTVLYGTVGLTNRIDFSVAIPIISVSMAVSSRAQLLRVSGPTFVLQPTSAVNPVPCVFNPVTNCFQNPHQFENGTVINVFQNNGSASGIGDVTFRVKANLYQTESYRVAVGLDVRAPSGDARQFLGAGAAGIKPFVAVSAGKRFSPHVNLGYQWNGESILAGDVTGTIFSINQANQSLIQNGPSLKRKLPNQFSYSIGADVGVTRRLTVAFDYLGQSLFDAPRVFRANFVTQNIPGGTGALTLPTISSGSDNVGLNSGAAGLKYNLFDRLIVTADLLFRLDDKGLRQDVTPLIALSYAFRR